MEDEHPPGSDATTLTHDEVQEGRDLDGESVVCKIYEHEESVVDFNGLTKSRQVTGDIEIINPSNVDRIWGVSVQLSRIESTTLETEKISLREIQPDSSHRTSYSSESDTHLSLREVIDTEPVRDEVPSISLPFTSEPHVIKLKILVENVSSEVLSDIVVTRIIPEQWNIKPGLDYSLTDDELVWKIQRLDINQITILELEPTVAITSTDAIMSGATSASYRSSGLLSGLACNSLRASTRHISYVTATEGERPGEWECVCAFENASSFSLNLEAASMEVVGKDEPLMSVSGLREIIRPQNTWKSQPVPYSSSERPRFTQRIQSSVSPRMDIGSSGSITMLSRSLPVVDARVEKGYDRSRLRSFTPDELETIVTVENVGSSAINLVRLVDDLPHIFTKVGLEDIHADIDGKGIPPENMRMDLVEGRSLTPQDSSGQGHTIQLLIGTTSPISLEPGGTLKVVYPAATSDPTATETSIGSPCRVDLSSERHGPVITRDCVKIPAIEVITQRREFKSGKSIFPGPEPGQHEVRMMFNNTSDTPLEDVVILDSPGVEFKMISSEVSSSTGREVPFEHTTSVDDGHEVHRWEVGRVERSETIEVKTLIESDNPEADPEESGSMGAEFGEESEVEPNLPRWFGEDGDWIHGVPKGVATPVPICAICGTDIIQGALICQDCAESRADPISNAEEE